MARYPTLRALRGAREGALLQSRAQALLAGVRRYAPRTEPAAAQDSAHLRVIQWNVEHGNWYAPLERALLTHPRLAGADLVLCNEIDLGMGRAGNRDVTGDLADALGLHGVWAPLFLESTLGRDDDILAARGRVNEESLFGVAVLSRWPLGEVRVVPLPGPDELLFSLERLVGRYAALIVEVLHPRGTFVAVGAHLEVHRTRDDRARQIATVVEALAAEHRPVVFAGDFNTHTFDRGRPLSTLTGAWPLLTWPLPALRERLLHPDRGRNRESLFSALAAGGFAWEPYADHQPTLRVRFDRLTELQGLPPALATRVHRGLAWAEKRAQLRLDWVCARGFDHARGSGGTVEGLDGPTAASDHAPIVAELAFL